MAETKTDPMLIAKLSNLELGSSSFLKKAKDSMNNLNNGRAGNSRGRAQPARGQSQSSSSLGRRRRSSEPDARPTRRSPRFARSSPVSSAQLAVGPQSTSSSDPSLARELASSSPSIRPPGLPGDSNNRSLASQSTSSSDQAVISWNVVWLARPPREIRSGHEMPSIRIQLQPTIIQGDHTGQPSPIARSSTVSGVAHIMGVGLALAPGQLVGNATAPEHPRHLSEDTAWSLNFPPCRIDTSGHFTIRVNVFYTPVALRNGRSTGRLDSPVPVTTVHSNVFRVHTFADRRR